MISNDELLERRIRLRDEDTGPRIGDFVIPHCSFATGKERTERIAHDWGDLGVQTAPGGSFYLGEGFVSFSGALNPMISTALLDPTGEIREGWFWFFSRDLRKARNGVKAQAPCRVYRYRGAIDEHMYLDGRRI